MARVKLENLVKKYDKQIAVDNINLDIEHNEFIVLVGPSGCGKSTTLRMIAGLEEISSGRILIGDKVVNDLDPRLRNISMVFQNYALYPHMNVRENLGFSLKIAKINPTEAKIRVDEALRILNLEELGDRKPSQLSGGQRQRVAMGRAIVRHPEAFLFDEPLSNLDAKLRVQMRTEIKRLHQKIETTIIYVTHDQVEAMTLADRIVLMKSGKIVQNGTPLELYEEPVNSFVATFIGSPPMNLIDCKLIEGHLVLTEDIRIPLPAKFRDCAFSSPKMILGIRSDYLSPVGYGWEAENVYTFKTRVEFSEPLGSESLLNIRIGDKEMLSKMFNPVPIKDFTVLDFTINPDRIHLFDSITGDSYIAKK